MPDPATGSGRPYHHGQLAEALVDASVAMARIGGPDAVVLREAARRVGVSATAAYRHFDGQAALLDAVKNRALGMLDDWMQSAAQEVPTGIGDRERAAARLTAIGRAYLDFALSEKGLFECFCVGLPLPDGMALDVAVPAFGVLTSVIDEMVAAGALEPARRPGAEVAAWAAVHGLAVLALDGVLAAHPAVDMAEMIQAVVNLVLYGLLPR